MIHKHAIIGGTFDHLHRGHEAMIHKAFTIAEKVTIGITTSEMISHKSFADQIEPHAKRRSVIEKFLFDNGLSSRAHIISIHDKYGSILTDPTIDAIVVSPATETVGKAIIADRIVKGLSQVKIVTVPFIIADDKEPISSERIRSGVISRSGFSYRNYFLHKPLYHLPPSLRSELAQPIGKVCTTSQDFNNIIGTSRIIISVGDIVTISLVERGITPHLALVDFKNRRRKIDSEIISTYFSRIKHSIENQPGTITIAIAAILQSLCQDSTGSIVKIVGEEDLLTIPAILLSPLNSLVLYGQHGKGMVAVDVTEEKKNYCLHLLQKFT